MRKKPVETTVPYKEIRDKLDTFTIVNCIADRWPFSMVGHTAVLYKVQETGQLMVFESTTLNKYTGISGVQMTPFGIWLARYPGKVYVRIPTSTMTQYHDGIDQNYKRRKLAAAFVREHLGTSYPDLKTRSGRFKLYLAMLDFKLFGKDIFTYKGNDDGLFCTQLVVMMYQHCGLLLTYYDSLQPHEFLPADMRGDLANNVFDCQLDKCELGSEIRIK